MNNDKVEIIKTLDNNNYEQMYVSDTEVVEPKSKSIIGYIKHKIYKWYNYFKHK